MSIFYWYIIQRFGDDLIKIDDVNPFISDS